MPLATVARRGRQLLANVARVTVVPDIAYLGAADLFVLRIRCLPGAGLAVAERLARWEDVRFVALTTGAADVVAELVARRGHDTVERLISDVQAINGVSSLESDLMLHTYKVAHDWSRQLISGEDGFVPAQEPHRCDPSHFDPTDHALLSALRIDGRASFRAVAAELGVDESTVRRRFEALTSAGCLSVVTLVPATSLGFESEILLNISVSPAQLDEVARSLAAYRGVRYLAATLNSSSLMCELILPSPQDVFTFLTNVLARCEGVTGWTAGLELLTLKRGFTAASSPLADEGD